MRSCRLLLAALAASALASSGSGRRPVQYSDIPESLRPDVASLGSDAPSFAASVRRLGERTRERQVEGENEHLVYYVLQSSGFTGRPRIEPGESARSFVLELPPSEKERFLNGEAIISRTEQLPEAVSARMRDFLASTPSADERLKYFRDFLRARAPERAFEYFCAAYARAMFFLYRKEFSAGSGAEVAALYEARGHSTDTAVEANFAVYNALGALRGSDPGFACRRALVVGPGLDFAPRTDLVDLFPPQSYQPFAVADGLIALGFSATGEIALDCVDINPRVIRFFEEFSRRPRPELTFFSGVREIGARRFTEDFRGYFGRLGRSIGSEGPLDPVPAPLAGRLAKRLVVRRDVARRVRAEILDVVAERYDPAPGYDLAIATNVLTYFSPRELALALVNIASMLKDGGYLIHNDARPPVLELAARAGFRTIECRTVLIAPGGERALYDNACTLRKRAR
jgi:hypothetical protein